MSRKLKSRITLTLVFVLCCVVTGVFFYAQLNLKEKNQKADLFSLVPLHAQAIIETNNINSLFQALEASPFVDEYEQLHFSDLFNFLNHKIDEIAEEKGHGLSVPMSNVLISFHNPGLPEDQVLYGHLGNGDRNLMEDILRELSSTGYTPKEVSYKGEKIIIYPLDNGKFLACFFQQNSYAISFQKKLIEAVIDAATDKASIRHDSLFAKIYRQKKSENATRLYARTRPIADWTQYDLHLQGNAIYLTGLCYRAEGDKDCYYPQLAHARVPLLSADFLPTNTYTFYQMGIPQIQHLVDALACRDSIAGKDTLTEHPLQQAFYRFVEDYTRTELDIIGFRGNDSTEDHRVMLLPLRFELSATRGAWQKIARSGWKRIWHKGQSYPIYTLPNNRLAKHLLTERAAEADKLHAILNEQYLILSDREEDLRAYLNKRSYSEVARVAWTDYLDTLAPEANFTFFADMEDIYLHPNEFKTILPPFFFNHPKFFGDFTITLQFIEANETLNTNITLNFKH